MSLSTADLTATSVLAPVTLGGDVYVVARTADAFRPGVAAAVDAATGTPAWTATLEIPVNLFAAVDTPAYHEGRVQVPLTAGRFGNRFVIDPATGAVTTAGSASVQDFAVHDGQLVARSVSLGGITPPVVVTQITWRDFQPVVVSTGTSVGEAAGDYAFVGESIAWSDRGTNAQGYAPDCPRPVANLDLCMPSWSTDLGAVPGNPTAVGDDAVVYADRSGTVSVLDMATGAVRWQAELGGVTLTPATMPPDLVLVGTSDGRLAALTAAGCGAAVCDPVWEGALAGAARAVVGAGDVAYVATDTAAGDIQAFDLAGCGSATCDPLVTVATGAPSSAAMIVHDGRLLAGTTDGRLVAFGLP